MFDDKQPVRILGIDPGLSTTGYGVVDGAQGSPSAVAAGVITTDRAGATATRLHELHRDLVDLISEYRPTEVAVEQVFVNKNLRTAMSVARASGVVLLAAADAGLQVSEYTPSAVKAAVAGFGGAEKSQVQVIVSMRLGLKHLLEPADAADALAVALCHLQHSGSTSRAASRDHELHRSEAAPSEVAT